MPHYVAFVSYSHVDRGWGAWLHKALEAYRVPRRLVGTPGRDGPIPARLYPVFRHREELPAPADLSEQIAQALRDSACLIVICSPHAACSRWVNEEVLTFKRLGREDRILGLIVAGEPHASERPGAKPALECFPPALRARLGADAEASGAPMEPFAADVSPQADGREAAKLKVIAGILGVSYDSLRQRELEAARRRTRIARSIAATMLILAMLATGGGLLAWAASVAARERLDVAQRAQSRAVLQTVQDAPPHVAVPALLAALPRSVAQPDRPLVPEVASSLALALSQWDELGRAVVAPGEKLAGMKLAAASARLVAFSFTSIATFTVPGGERLRTWRPPGGVADAAISDDGLRVAVASNAQVGPPLVVHDVAGEDGARPVWLPAAGSAGLVGAAGQAADGALIVAFSRGGTSLAALDPADGRIVDAGDEPEAQYAPSIWLDPSGHVALLFAGSVPGQEGAVVAWALGKRLRRIATLPGLLTSSGPLSQPSMAVSRDETVLAILLPEDGIARFFDLSDGHALGQASLGGKGTRLAAGFAGHDVVIVDRAGALTSASPDGTVRRFARPKTEGKPVSVRASALSGDGALLYLLLSDGGQETWDWAQNRRVAAVDAVAGTALATTVMRDGAGTGVLLGRADGTVEWRGFVDLVLRGTKRLPGPIRRLGRVARPRPDPRGAGARHRLLVRTGREDGAVLSGRCRAILAAIPALQRDVCQLLVGYWTDPDRGRGPRAATIDRPAGAGPVCPGPVRPRRASAGDSDDAAGKRDRDRSRDWRRRSPQPGPQRAGCRTHLRSLGPIPGRSPPAGRRSGVPAW